MLKVVVDINLFVSSIISKKGAPARLLQIWREDGFSLVISETMLEDVKRVLQYAHIKNKYNLQNEAIEQVVDAVKRLAIVLSDEIELDVIKDDPDDNIVLAYGLAAKADYIVSGDKHLLKLGIFEGISIVSVNDFLDRVEYNK